jgi:hypothetical protein
VEHLPVGVVEPAEHQALTGRVEVRAAGGGGEGRDVALVQRLRRLALVGALALALAAERVPAQFLEPGVRPVDLLLLARDLRLERRVEGGGGGQGSSSGSCCVSTAG